LSGTQVSSSNDNEEEHNEDDDDSREKVTKSCNAVKDKVKAAKKVGFFLGLRNASAAQQSNQHVCDDYRAHPAGQGHKKMKTKMMTIQRIIKKRMMIHPM
jgi:hypothetical protein